jgi:asparagine synthase (glutamine-hydrolysing)
MCGIVGIFRFDGKAVDEQALRDLNACIIHRGPDDSGIFVDKELGLAMRRLSIIDIACGHQPMFSADGRYVIVYNGEVYNYREIRAELEALGHGFNTESDTEAILLGYQQWGPGVLDHMIGMWGLAIFDTLKRELFLARDRLGKKQIYYALTPRYLVFGSEMVVPMRFSADHRRLDVRVLPEYLKHGYIGGADMPVRGIRLLPASHWVLIDKEGIREQSYWSVACPSPEPLPRSEEEAAEHCYRMIVDAVRYRLVADVPISVMLSSGLDSSTLAYVLARELGASLQAFTLGYHDAAFDESRDAGRFAERLGLKWHHETVSGRQVANDFADIVAHTSALQGNTAQIVYYYVSRMIRSAGYKVALNGNGGDELFAGYPTYQATHIFRYWRHLPAAVRQGAHSLAEKLPASFGRVSFDYKIKKFTEIGDGSAMQAHGYWRTMFAPEELRALLRREAVPDLASHTSLYDGVFAKLGQHEDVTVNDLLKSDMLGWLQPMLPWTDNMSMAHSVELRLPMLDHRLVNYVYGLPEHYIFRGWTLRRLMKRFLSERLPREVVFRRKRGTHLPVSRWLGGEMREIAETYLSPNALEPTGIFEAGEVQRLWDQHRTGRRDNTFKLWNLIVFSAWMKHYGVTL